MVTSSDMSPGVTLAREGRAEGDGHDIPPSRESRLARIEAMLGELLRRDTAPEGLGKLWTAFPWLTPVEPPKEASALSAWLAATTGHSEETRP